MTFSYSFSLASNLDKVRFLLGDTEEADRVLEDEEILSLLNLYGNVTIASAAAAWSGYRRLASLSDMKVGVTTITFKERATTWKDTAQRLTPEGYDFSTFSASPIGGTGTAQAFVADEVLEAPYAFHKDADPTW